MIQKNQYQKLYDRKLAPKIKVEWFRFFGIVVAGTFAGCILAQIALFLVFYVIF